MCEKYYIKNESEEIIHVYKISKGLIYY